MNGVWEEPEVDGFCCVDCAMVIANGDTSGIESPERLAEVLAGVARIGNAYVSDGHEHFSRSRCDCCLSSLAGERLTYNLVGGAS